jgi:hypothetical protein
MNQKLRMKGLRWPNKKQLDEKEEVQFAKRE